MGNEQDMIQDFIRLTTTRNGNLLKGLLVEGNYLLENLEGEQRVAFHRTWKQRYELGKVKNNDSLVANAKAITDFIDSCPAGSLLYLHVHKEKLSFLFDSKGQRSLEFS
jgi:hypothetical protein